MSLITGEHGGAGDLDRGEDIALLVVERGVLRMCVMPITP